MSQDLASQIAKALAEYSTEVEEKVDKIAEETAEEAVQELNTTSPKSPRAKGGKYAKSWKKQKWGKVILWCITKITASHIYLNLAT